MAVVTLTDAVIFQVPKLIWGAVISGLGSLKFAEAIPVELVNPCLTIIVAAGLWT